jgi:hypothetical protein
MSTAVQVNTEYLELSNQTDDETDFRKLYEIIRSEANNKDSIITVADEYTRLDSTKQG